MRDLRLYPGLDRVGVVELILISELVVLWPLFNYLPSWIRVFCLSVIGIRFFMVRRQWKVPGRAISGLLGVCVAGAIYYNYGTFLGRDAGVSLIVVMFSLKLLEMKFYRDAALILYLSFFIMVANFLFSQSLLMAGYLILCILIVMTALQALNRTDGGADIKFLVRQSSLMFLQAIPLMLIFFVFFPRFAEPLWQMPSNMKGTTGISDSMTPGDIGSLVNFDEVAFRVEFEGDVPQSSELYWRGLVFSAFDGLTWSRERTGFQQQSDVILAGKPYSYRILLEPHQRKWLYAMEMPESMPVARTTNENTWSRRFDLRSRLAYSLTSYSGSSFGYELSAFEQRSNTQLPGDNNPRARRWAQQQYLDNQASPEAYINSVLRKINSESYIYTLNPGVMAADTVDDFWFNKQRGFCEHYAGTFVFLMRAAGIPARVVTGYQGGEMNPYADYMVVRQSDAHAWTEVWLSGKGWVRIDPTGAIHPSRVEVDLSYNWARREALFGDVKPANWGQFAPGVIDSMQLMWDTINNNWQSMVIDFDAGAQHELFADLGFPNLSMSELAKALVVFATLIMMVTVLVLLRKRSRLDKVAMSYNKLNRKLSRIGFTRKPTEGPVDFFQRVISRRPDLEAQLKPVLQLYLSIRFRESRQTASQVNQFRKRVNSLSLPGKG